MRLFSLSAIICFVIDQTTKWAVLYWVGLAQWGVIDVFPPLLVFRLGWNEGINFGLFASGSQIARWLLVMLALVICGWIVWWAKTGLAHPMARVAAGAVVGGALGNVLDRILYGAVVDFLNMSCCGIQNPFVFNVADIMIFVGAVGLLIFADRSKISSQDTP